MYILKENIEIPNCFQDYYDEIDEFAKLIGPQLHYCNLDDWDTNLKLSILKRLKNIKEIVIESRYFKKVYFDYLKSFKNLTSLKWIRNNSNQVNMFNNLMITFQRVNRLNVDMMTFLNVNFQLNNLTELTLRGGYGEENKIDGSNGMVLEYLKKLKIINFINYNSMSKMALPKLESVSIKEPPLKFGIPASFFNQIKNIKHLSMNILNKELIS